MDERSEAGDPQDPTSTSSTDGAWASHSSNILAALTAGALLIGTVMYRLLEDWGWVDSLYFSVISLIGAYLNEVMKRRAKRAAGRRSEL